MGSAVSGPRGFLRLGTTAMQLCVGAHMARTTSGAGPGERKLAQAGGTAHHTALARRAPSIITSNHTSNGRQTDLTISNGGETNLVRRAPAAWGKQRWQHHVHADHVPTGDHIQKRHPTKTRKQNKLRAMPRHCGTGPPRGGETC